MAQSTTAKQGSWKDRAEYDLVQSALSSKPEKKLELLNQWNKSYPETDFKELRLEAFIDTYQVLNQPDETLASARALLVLNPKNLKALYQIALLTVSLNQRSPDTLDLAEKAAAGLLNAEKPPQVSDEQWKSTQTEIARAGQRALAWVASRPQPTQETALAADALGPPRSASAVFNAGQRAFERRDYGKAMKNWLLLATAGDAVAQSRLGPMYENGLGAPQNYAEAVRWYRKAADQGDVAAQSRLGVLYDKGLGVPQDYAEAVRWYRKAADQGEAFAEYKLGGMYALGQGVALDHGEAIRWYRKAASQGNHFAEFALEEEEDWMRREAEARVAREAGAEDARRREAEARVAREAEVEAARRRDAEAMVARAAREAEEEAARRREAAARVAQEQDAPRRRQALRKWGDTWSQSGSTAKYNNVFVGQRADDPAIRESGCEFVRSLGQTFMEIVELKQPRACGLASKLVEWGGGGDGPKTVQTILVVSRAPFQDVLASLVKAYGPPLPDRVAVTGPSLLSTTWIRKDGTVIAAAPNHGTNRDTGETVRFTQVVLLKRY